MEIMTDHKFEHSRLRDALKEVTRKERRSLLGISLVGIALSVGGMVPSKIPSLGIDFQLADQRILLLLVAFIIVYFIVAFTIYATTDYLSWKLEINSWEIEQVISDMEEEFRSHCPQPGTCEYYIEKATGKYYSKNRIYLRLTAPISIVRALFDFALPVVVGLCALFLLIQFANGLVNGAGS